MVHQQQQHFLLFPIGSQQIHVAFDGGRIVSDSGLRAVGALEKSLRVLAGLAQRLPDPRLPKLIEHSAEALLTQAVYPIRAGYPDCRPSTAADAVFPETRCAIRASSKWCVHSDCLLRL